ncbi:hypothetical protein GMRT_12557 [Giardia muris]|uniref:Uncharacterized protein n=1 Tax=Giardia muris TaxID=5742 RepID=A0A4Z1STW7_GIAMU|nr:hypothetical protein GMRT_12557 [Giardia muris]|eukprot:TNJ28425.1 hypothetical protein GMRT_12557 [Giardia muris]
MLGGNTIDHRVIPPLEDLRFVRRRSPYARNQPAIVVAFESHSRFSDDTFRIIQQTQELLPMLYYLAVSREHPVDLRAGIERIGSLARINVASDVRGTFAKFLQENGVTCLPTTLAFAPLGRLLWHGHAQSKEFAYCLQRLRTTYGLPVPPLSPNDVFQLPILPVSDYVLQVRGSVDSPRPSVNVNDQGTGVFTPLRASVSVDNNHSRSRSRGFGHAEAPSNVFALSGVSVSQSPKGSEVGTSHYGGTPSRSSGSILPNIGHARTASYRETEPAQALNKSFKSILIHDERVYPPAPHRPPFVPENPMADRLGMEKLFSLSTRLIRRVG